jgi:hypothetical protein
MTEMPWQASMSPPQLGVIALVHVADPLQHRRQLRHAARLHDALRTEVVNHPLALDPLALQGRAER